MSRRRPALAVLCAALCVLPLAACGDDGEPAPAADRSPAAAAPPRDDAVDALLAQTFGERAASPERGRIDASLRVRGRGIGALRGPLAIELSGPFDVSREGLIPRLDLRARIDPPRGRALRSGAVSTGRSAYVIAKGRAYEMPPELFALLREGLRGSKGGAVTNLSSLGVDPRRWLVDARRLGVERVDGVRTVHVRGSIDVPRLLADVDALLGQASQIGVLLPGGAKTRLSPADRRRIAESVRGSTVDLWMGAEDRILRRLEVGVDLADQGSLDLRLDVSDVGEPQRIRAPRDARPFSELITGALGNVLGGSGAGAEALRCVRESAGDPAALQRCALELAP